MAGKAILAFVPDLMFSVQLREAAGRDDDVVTVVKQQEDYEQKLTQVAPALVVLDLSSVGGDLEHMVSLAKRSGAHVVAFGPHVQKDLLARAKTAGCDAVFPNSKFKMDTESILQEWVNA
ncbi:hypothetical protein [Ferroacidibacillus organovorans]|uniref:Response regulatory domain-containing protein n=1 Tax=Ferroacidibacillus organovorans TaxID=1765683 RepID=A0A1V4EQQ6_9BACL|nr:hypothetical protein [Ferroacidibacillus organovorans]OPG15256.1 hypothetical protein B2M26_12365 [Ferroacidibacillus organovorans]